MWWLSYPSDILMRLLQLPEENLWKNYYHFKVKSKKPRWKVSPTGSHPIARFREQLLTKKSKSFPLRFFMEEKVCAHTEKGVRLKL